MKNISTPQASVSVRLFLMVFTITFLFGISRSSNVYAEQDLRTNNLRFSTGKMPALATLPVVLTPLKGYYSKGVSHLYWKSLQESSSSHFEVQRSNDGITYIQVGKVAAKGSSDKEVEYSFDDIKTNAGLNYYRLKLIDKDGKFQYSSIELLTVNIKGINVTGIYPAPFTDKVNVTISSELRTQAVIHLFDNTGKFVVGQQTNIDKGITNLAIENLNNLAKGLYIIKVQAGETVIVKKIVK